LEKSARRMAAAVPSLALSLTSFAPPARHRRSDESTVEEGSPLRARLRRDPPTEDEEGRQTTTTASFNKPTYPRRASYLCQRAVLLLTGVLLALLLLYVFGHHLAWEPADMFSTNHHIQCRPRGQIVVAGQRISCHVRQIGSGVGRAIDLRGYSVVAHVADYQNGTIVERPAVVLENDGTTVHMHATKMGRGRLHVAPAAEGTRTDLHSQAHASGMAHSAPHGGLSTEFKVLADEAVAGASSLVCDRSRVQPGEHVACRLHFFDEYGNPAPSWPQDGPGLGAVTFDARPLGTAERAEALSGTPRAGAPRQRTIGHGLTGFVAGAPGRAGVELTPRSANSGTDATTPAISAWVVVLRD